MCDSRRDDPCSLFVFGGIRADHSQACFCGRGPLCLPTARRLARYAPPVATPPDYATAARRHYKDAQFLFGGDRWPNADHLAGVAAECGLKTILLGYFGATLNQRNMPVYGQPNRWLGHLNALWNELPQVVSGRTAGPVFTALLAGQPPFVNWNIDDRYSDGSAITEQDARGHISSARAILGILEQAILTGTVP